MKELFIVEGDKASISVSKNRKFQALIPLKGKPLNTEKKREEKITKEQKRVYSEYVYNNGSINNFINNEQNNNLLIREIDKTIKLLEIKNEHQNKQGKKRYAKMKEIYKYLRKDPKVRAQSFKSNQKYHTIKQIEKIKNEMPHLLV